MPTIYWKPIDLTKISPGQKLNKTGIDLASLLHGNERWVQNFYTPAVMMATYTSAFPASGSSHIGAFTNANSVSPAALTRFMVRGNAARHPVKVTALALVTNSGTTGTLTLTHGGASSTVSVTSTTAASVSVTVTPSSGSSPLEAVLSGHTDDSNHIVLVALSARLVPADRTDGGAGSDDYTPLYDLPTSKAVPTEWVGRGFNNMRALARDRVACLASLAHPLNLSGSAVRTVPWHNLTTSSALLGRLHVFECENVVRPGVVSVYIAIESGNTGKVQIIVGGGGHNIHTVTSSGWIHENVDLQKQGTHVSIYGQLDNPVSADGIALLTAQVMRRT